MIWSSKSRNNLYRISTFLECLIKLLYPIRSNINNTKFVVVGTLCRKKKTQRNNAFTKKGERERKSEGRLLKAVQHRKHEFKAPASQQVNPHIEYLAVCHTLILAITFSNLADAFIQSDLQMRTMEAIKTNKRATTCKCYDKSRLA